MTAQQPCAVLLMGPTAAGKTDMAVEMARHWPFELISVDSALVYRGMNIGTGKPDRDTLRAFPHHLVDILDPRESYSAGQFLRDASALITDILARGRVPLLVGGTMLYYRALLHGIADMPTADPAFRAALEQRAAAVGWPALHAELAQRDPTVAARIGVNDGQRIQRALEVIHLTGRSMSEMQRKAQPPLPGVRFIKLGLMPGDRAQLYERIERRFQLMMQQGFLDEVRALYERGDLHADLPSMRAVGYRQLWNHLTGNISLEQAIAAGVLATRHLARRQLVWMRAESELEWLDGSVAGAWPRIRSIAEPLFG